MTTSKDSLPHKDMRVGLIIFGSLSIAIGGLCLLAVPLMLLGSLIPVKGQEPMPLTFFLPGMLFYLAIATVDIWLGVGSILCKRWARSLLQLISLFFLFTGGVSLIAFILMSGSLDAELAKNGTQMPAGFAAGFKITMFLFMGLFYVILPGSFAFFYSLRSTRLTCEDRHPSPAWTDRCPLPVLALSLLAGFWTLSLPMVLLYAPVFPFFGMYLEGVSALLTILVLAVLFGWTAWGLYQQKETAWWISLGATVLLLASYIFTINHLGLMEMYRHMHFPAQTLKVLESSPILQNNWLGWFGLLFAVPYVGFMLYARKYFTKPE